MEVEIRYLGEQLSPDILTDQYREPEAILPFKYKGGVPWIEVRIASVAYKFGLDTASEYNVMHEK